MFASTVPGRLCRFATVLALLMVLQLAAINGSKQGEPSMEEMLAAMPKDEQRKLRQKMMGKVAKQQPLKELTLKRARKMMKELKHALTSEKAVELMTKARPSGADQAAVMSAVSPVAEGIVKSVLVRYGFASPGLQLAVQSAMHSGNQADREIAAALEDMTEMITGELSPRKEGRVVELDLLAADFLDMIPTAREKALAKTKTTSGGDDYADAMQGVVAVGATYITDTIVALVKKVGPAQNFKDDSPEIKKVHRRLNVFGEFLRAQDHNALGRQLGRPGGPQTSEL